MPRTNAENVRTYYGRNKNLVHFRKAMNRCRESGAVPNASTMRKYEIPLTALLVAFGEWAGTTWDVSRVQQQHCRLTQLRVELGPVRKTDFVDPTPDERKALTYLRRFSHPQRDFGAFMTTVSDRQDSVGDVARDFKYDIRHNGVKASSYKTPTAFKNYLQTHDACDGAFDALRKAVELWKKSA